MTASSSRDGQSVGVRFAILDFVLRGVGEPRRVSVIALLCALVGAMGCPGGDGGGGDGDGADRDGSVGEGPDASMAGDGDGDGDGAGQGDGDGDGDGDDGTDESAGGAGGGTRPDPDDHDRPFEGNGISALVDGERITYANVLLLPNNSGNGILMFEAGTANGLAKWRLFVPSTPGTYACDDAVEETVLQLIDVLSPARSGVASGRGGCSVTLRVAADGVYSGTFEGELEPASPSGDLIAVTEGFFHYDMYSRPGDDEELPEGEAGGSFMLEGDTWTYPTVSLWPFETYAAITLQPALGDTTSPGFPQGIQLHTLPNEAGTYACGEGASYRAVNVWFWWKGDWYYAGNRQSAEPAGPAGSACTITLTEVGTIEGFTYAGTLAGTFSGTFVTSDGSKSIEVTGGSFRATGSGS